MVSVALEGEQEAGVPLTLSGLRFQGGRCSPRPSISTRALLKMNFGIMYLLKILYVTDSFQYHGYREWTVFKKGRVSVSTLSSFFY